MKVHLSVAPFLICSAPHLLKGRIRKTVFVFFGSVIKEKQTTFQTLNEVLHICRRSACVTALLIQHRAALSGG